MDQLKSDLHLFLQLIEDKRASVTAVDASTAMTVSAIMQRIRRNLAEREAVAEELKAYNEVHNG